jgi:hypothetical protein
MPNQMTTFGEIFNFVPPKVGKTISELAFTQSGTIESDDS